MELPDSIYLDNAISYIERLMKEKKKITPKMIDSEVESVILDAQDQYGVQSNPPMYAHHLRERKTHGLSLKQMRRLYAMVSRGSQKAITFARNVLGIPFDETPSQVKAVVKHHVLDLAERKLKRVDWRKNDAYAESWLKRKLRGNPYRGFVGKGEYVWKKLTPTQRLRFIMESPRGRQSTPRSVELFASRAWSFLPRSLKIDLEARFANVESDELVKNPATDHRTRIALQTVRRPMEGYFLGGPDLEESVRYLLRKGYTMSQLRKINPDVEDFLAGRKSILPNRRRRRK